VSLDNDPKPLKGYILSFGPDAVTIFTEEKTLSRFPRARVTEIRMEKLEDVLLARLGVAPAVQNGPATDPAKPTPKLRKNE